MNVDVKQDYIKVLVDLVKNVNLREIRKVNDGCL